MTKEAAILLIKAALRPYMPPTTKKDIKKMQWENSKRGIPKNQEICPRSMNSTMSGNADH